MEYGPSHRLVLTYIKSAKYISQTELTAAFTKILQRLNCQTEDINQSLNDHINLINKRIGEHGFKIERNIDEFTRQLHFSYANLQSDEISKSFSVYSVNDLDIIKKLIEAIVESSHDFSIGEVNAKQLIVARNKSGSEAETFISSLIDNGWFNSHNHRLILSQRSITELKSYLIDRYGTHDAQGKIIICNECKAIVTVGKFVQDLNLGFHNNCLEIYESKNQAYETTEIGVS